jgi:hypothetical protein
MLPLGSLARSRALKDFVANLPEMDQGSPHLPQEHEKFTKTMEQIEQQAKILKKTIERLKPTTSVKDGVKMTLGQIESLREKYQQEFEQVERRATPEGASAEDVAKLRSLRQAIKPGHMRIIFIFYQLMIEVQSNGKSPALIGLLTADFSKMIPVVVRLFSPKKNGMNRRLLLHTALPAYSAPL